MDDESISNRVEWLLSKNMAANAAYGVSTLKQIGERTVFEKERDNVKGITK